MYNQLSIAMLRPTPRHAAPAVLVRQDTLTSVQDIARQRRAVVGSTTRAAQRFAEYDVNGDMLLDFEEFYAMQPRRLRDTHRAEDIQRWFDAADIDGSGLVSANEFFQFSLGAEALKNGAHALDLAFARYDKDGSGVLDLREFTKAAAEMGFGAVASDIFRTFDADQSGAISYRELHGKLCAHTPSDPQAQALLLTLVWSVDEANEEETMQALQATPSWRLKSRDAPSLRLELQRLLQESGCHVADLLRLFDQDAAVNDHQIDDMEFLQAMRAHFGYRGPSTVIGAVFRELDSDCTGTIGFDELYEFIRGRRHSLDRRNMQVRRPPRRCSRLLGPLS